MSGKTSRITQTAYWLENYWPELLELVGASLLAIAGILAGLQNQQNLTWLYSTRYGLIFLLGVLLSFVGSIKSLTKNPAIKKLQEENEKLREEKQNLESELADRQQGYFDLLDRTIQELFVQLKFGNSERISLYKHDGKAFIMLSRYSVNPSYNGTGRAVYPDNQGCIGVAWQNGSAFVDGLQGPSTKGYVEKMHNDWNMPREVTEKLVMKSRSLAAFAINDATGFKRIAVIVFESTEPMGVLDHTFLQKKIDEEERLISANLEKLNDVEPSPSLALSKGY